MPRYYRRRRTRAARRGSVAPLIFMLLLGLLLLFVVMNGETLNLPLGQIELPQVNLPPLPNIQIPITGLPQVKVPEVRLPVTLEPGSLPEIRLEGTPVVSAPSGAPAWGSRSKTTGCQVSGSLPDSACTPGALVSVTRDDVCAAGYAGSVGEVPGNVREEVFTSYGIAGTDRGQYQIDHLVPISLGGSNDIANLWPSAANPRPGYEEKNLVESYLHDQVCSGQMTLEAAQRQIAVDWTDIYERMPR